MKRNIALLLAGVLITSAVPTKVSAYTLGNYYNTESVETRQTGKISTGLSMSPISTQPKTLFVEPGANKGDKAGSIKGNDYIEHWVEGGYFEITVPSIESKEELNISLKLHNAEWNFDNTNLGIKTIKNGTFDPKNNEYKYTGKEGEEGSYTLKVSRFNPSEAIMTIKGSNQPGDDKPGEENLAKQIEKNLDAMKSMIGNFEGEENTTIYGILNQLKKIVESKEDNNGQILPELLPGNEEMTSLISDLIEENYVSKADAKKELKDVTDIINNIVKAIKEAGISGNESDDDIKEKKSSLENIVKAIKFESNIEKLEKTKKFLVDESNINEFIKDFETQVGNLLGEKEKLSNLIGKIPNKAKAENNKEPKEKTYRVPIVARTLEEGKDSSISVLGSNKLPVETDMRTFAIGTKEGLTTTLVKNPVTARTRFKIEAIGIKENRISSLPENGAFAITAPSGYRFLSGGKNIEVVTEGGIEFSKKEDKKDDQQNTTPGATIKLEKDNSVLVVTYNGLKKSTNLTGTLVIQGVELISTNYNDDVTERDLYMSIKNIGKDATVTQQMFLAAYARDWKVNLTPMGTVPTIISGRLDSSEKETINDETHKAVTVKFEEQVPNAWWSERVTKFILPEGIKIRKAAFTNVKNIVNSDELSQGVYYNEPQKSGSVRIDDNVLTLSGLVGSREAKASFELNLWLSAEPGFSGNVDLKLTGSAINTEKNNKETSVVIAKVVEPISVKADLTDVKIGYEYVTVGDFEITETAAGRLRENEDVYVSIVANNASAVIVDPSFKCEVTDGNLKIRNVDVSGTQLQLGTGVNSKVNGVNIRFKIDKSSSKASKIKFSNLKVRLNEKYNSADREKFDLVVWGAAVANNYRGLVGYDKYRPDTNGKEPINYNDYFNKPGITVPYINAQINNGDLLKNVVKVKVGNPIILVNNKEVAMPTAAYVSKESNSTMVPVRFISTGLGIDESKIIWDAVTGTVTINAGNRVVQMTTGKDTIKINGKEVPMLSPDGLKVTVEVKDDRAFIPFRALGEAFGITVGWDATTATATYNEQNVSNLLPDLSQR